MKYEMRDMGYQQSGQIIIVLLLLMLVGLSIGLAYTQRSINDVTTSTQAEQSSRAFSAAEAGIEKALSGSVTNNTTVPFANNSSADVSGSAPLPILGSFAGIEYPPIGRETTAQFWFVDPSTAGSTPATFYNSSALSLFYGNADTTTDKPAVEVSIVLENNGNYYNKTYYYDSDPARAIANGNTFTASTCDGNRILPTGILGNNHKFYCGQVVGPVPNPVGGGFCDGTGSCKLILARVRFLYINENHKLAIAPQLPAQFPPQVQIYNATGTSGQSQKQIQAFKVTSVVPPWFDFAIFSVNDLRK